MMKSNQRQEDRDLMLRPEYWPHYPGLPLIRGGSPAYGVLLRKQGSLPDEPWMVLLNVTVWEPGEWPDADIKYYRSVDDLLDAGWWID